jgi:polyisoprenoid-binding protein YceI
MPGDARENEPESITEARNRIEAAKRGETGTETPAAPVVEPGAAPAPAAAPVQATKTEDELKAKLEDQRRDFERRSGEYGGNLQKLTQQIADLSARLKDLMDENARLRKDGGKADFFGPAPADAKFVSTRVVASGTSAKITGDLTLNGVTKPVVLDATFSGAGNNPFNKKATVGFHATSVIKRSAFGISYAVPIISDDVTLDISVAFEKAS